MNHNGDLGYKGPGKLNNLLIIGREMNWGSREQWTCLSLSYLEKIFLRTCAW